MYDEGNAWTQPPPQPSTGDIQKLVIDDMVKRREFGVAKYGTPLQANNGRDALADLYQELLDAVCYVRQMMEERNEQSA